MNKISDRTTTTVVKIFINTCSAIALIASPLTVHAQANNPTSGVVVNNGESLEVTTKKRCDDLGDKLRDAQSKISDACRKSGMGGGKACVEKVGECDEASGEDTFDTLGALGKAGATLFPGTAASAFSTLSEGDRNKGCPQMSGKDYFEEKERIEKETKETKEDLAKLDTERADAKKEYDDGMKDLQKDLADAQKDAKDKQFEIDEDTQKQLTEFQTNQAAAAKGMRDKKTDILTLQGELIALDRSKATALLELTDYVKTKTCRKEMLDAYKDYRATWASGGNTSISEKNYAKQTLISTYNKCMDGFAQKRMNVNESFKRQRDLLEKRIADAGQDVNSIDDGLKQSEDSLNALKQMANDKKSAALQAVIDQGTRAQSEMEGLFNQMQMKNSAIAKKEAAYNETLNKLNNELMTLGPAPKRGSDYAPSDAMADIRAGQSDLSGITSQLEKCPDQKKAAEKAMKDWGAK